MTRSFQEQAAATPARSASRETRLTNPRCPAHPPTPAAPPPPPPSRGGGRPPAPDQRGVPRPRGRRCDIGSFEATSLLVPPARRGLVPLNTGASTRATARPSGTPSNTGGTRSLSKPKGVKSHQPQIG